MRLTLFTVVLSGAVLAAGCNDNVWRDYRDDPFLADLAERGEQPALREINSFDQNQRLTALRLIAHQAGAARRNGRIDEAERLEGAILRRYQVEREPAVRAGIVRICAPAVGRGSSGMAAFLRERIAAGEFPGYAALSLVSLEPGGAFAYIEPLTRHPAPEVRLQAATALTTLRDPRGIEPVARVWRGMQVPPWPDRIEGAPLFEAKAGLAQRAERAFGQPLYGGGP
ncbi:MAG: hypothetical protein FWG74_04810 [Planctomycetes bacterium]|nr:hypothetical protein [Planctomycetota bacterium]